MPATYNPATNRFRTASGRPLTPLRIQQEVDRAITRAERRFRSLGRQLARGQLSIPEWQVAMKAEIKTLHTITSAVAKGGWKQMELSDWGRAGANIRREYRYLNRFANDLENGRVSAKQAAFRSTLYSKNARNDFMNEQMRREKEVSRQCRRVIHSKDGCGDCAAYTSWMPIEDMPAIGSLRCRMFCRCTIEYK